MMLEIRINGSTIDLGKGNIVSWERISPYFVYDDIFSGSVEIPSIPITSKNRAIFGFVDIVNLGSKHPRFTFEKYLNGQLIQEGTAFVSDVTADAYKLTVTERLDEFFGDIHNALLSQVDLGSLPLPETLLPAINDDFAGAAAYLPTIMNPDYYGDKGSEVGYTGIVNHYEAGEYQPGPKVPMPTVHHVLKQIGLASGVSMQGDFFEDPFCQRLIHYNIRALDGETEMILNRHVPDLTPPQYILELRKLLNLSLDFNRGDGRSVSKTLTIGFTDAIFSKSTNRDWSDKLVKGSRKIIERNRRLQLSMSLDQGDSLMKDKPAILDDFLTPAFADDLGIAAVKTVFSTLLTDEETGLATARQIGSTALFNLLPNRSAPRLLLWHGVDPEDGVPVALPYWEDQSLYWTGADGLKAARWAKTEAMRRDICYLDCELNLNEADLAIFDFKEKIHINGMDYLPLRIAGSFPLQAATKALLVQV